MTFWGYGRRRHAAAQPGAPALSIRALEAGHPGAPSVLVGLDLTVAVGQRVALTGPNGAGKSTLLKVIAGLVPVRAGEVRLYGNPVGACHHRVAYLPQRGEVDWRFPATVERLVMTGRYVHLGWLRRPRAADRASVAVVLERLGLAELAERQIGQLSGGQQQRALLARALAQGAELLLLDEPLNAVDAETRGTIAALLDELVAEGKTVLVATHELATLARDFDVAYRLEDGRAVVCEASAAVGSRPWRVAG